MCGRSLAVRDALIQTRTRYSAGVKALLRRDGWRLPNGTPEHTARQGAKPPPEAAGGSKPAPPPPALEPPQVQMSTPLAQCPPVSSTGAAAGTRHSPPAV